MPVIERETYAIICDLQKLDYYLSRATFTIKTNHRPLQYLLETKWTNKKIQQWALKLSGYNCKIEYLAGRDNICADLLSKIPKKLKRESVRVEPEVDDIAYQIGVINSNGFRKCPMLKTDDEEDTQVINDPHWEEEIKKKQIDTKIAEKAEVGDTSKYVIQEGKLCYLLGRNEEIRFRLYVPKGLRLEILEQSHKKLGHMRIDKTYDLIGQNYYWPKLYSEVTNYINSCVVCQTQNRK